MSAAAMGYRVVAARSMLTTAPRASDLPGSYQMLRSRHWSLTDPKSEILEAYQAIDFRGRLVVDVAQEISAA